MDPAQLELPGSVDDTSGGADVKHGICAQCGADFVKNHGNEKYCSDDCRADRQRERDHASKKAPCAAGCGELAWIYGPGCKPAGEAVCWGCRYDGGRTEYDHECERCGDSFTTYLDSSRFCSVFCSNRRDRPVESDEYWDPKERLRRKWRRHDRKRRAWLRDAESEPYTNREIAERDGWRCGICSKRIGRSYSYPHPRSLVIDHIVPLSRGGDDLKRNVQAAHHECNSAKGARAANSQLRMIG